MAPPTTPRPSPAASTASAGSASGGLLLNTTIVALGIATGKIIISMASAYAIVFFRFPLRMAIFWLIFITLMLPVEVRILPTYKVMVDLRLIDTYAGLILPLIASATATLLFRQFFLTIPNELLEAARIDGAGPLALLQGHPAAAVGAPTSPRSSSSSSSTAGTSTSGRCW